MPPALLNSREDAILLWTVAILSYVIFKDPRGIGGAFLGVLRALLAPKLLFLYGSAILYSGLVVHGAKQAGLWHTSATKATVYWFVGTAVVLVGYAITRTPASGGDFLRMVFKRVLGVTILIEFVVNVYALPLAYELVLVSILVILTGMQVVVYHDATADAGVRRFIDSVLVAVGLLYLAFFVVKALGDLDGFLSRENAEGFLVGPALTVALIPFLLAVAWLSRREQANLRKRFRSASGSASVV